MEKLSFEEIHIEVEKLSYIMKTWGEKRANEETPQQVLDALTAEILESIERLEDFKSELSLIYPNFMPHMFNTLEFYREHALRGIPRIIWKFKKAVKGWVSAW